MKNLNMIDALTELSPLKEQLKQQGYLFIKHFFSKEEVERLSEKVKGILEDRDWGFQRDGHLVPQGSVMRIGSKEFFETIAAMMAEDKLHEISLQGKLPALMKGLLVDDVFSHPRKMVRITYPYDFNPEDFIVAHQDLFYVKGEKDMLIAWIPLGDYPPECGGLEVGHGSHKMGLLPVKANKEGRFNCSISDIDNHTLDWRTAHYEIGDVLIMHSLTVHESGKNCSEYFRLSLDCRFSSLYGRVNADQLLPSYYPNVPDWQELTSKWAFNPFQVTPFSLQIESSNAPLEEVLLRKSAFV